MRSSSYRLGLKPGSVRLRSRALHLRFSRALAAGLVPRPPPGLSPRARSRGRAPTPCASTPNWADLAEMSRFYSLLEKIFVVLLLLRGDVSVIHTLLAKCWWCLLLIRVSRSACWTPTALPSSVPASFLRYLTAGCWSWAEIRVRARATAGCWSFVEIRARVLF